MYPGMQLLTQGGNAIASCSEIFAAVTSVRATFDLPHVGFGSREDVLQGPLGGY